MVEKRVLIVEDDGVVSQGLQLILKDIGYVVAGAVFSGEEALEKVEETNPDFVILDINLGQGMDGIEAGRKMKEWFNIPIIFLTAYSDEEILQRAKLVEPFGFLLKPVEPNMLRTTIEMALYRHQMDNRLHVTYQRLKKSEEKYRMLVERLNEGLGMSDEDENIIFANLAASRILGYPLEELIGKNLKDLISPNELERAVQETVVRKKGISSVYEIAIVRKDGIERILKVSASPIFDSDESFAGSMALFEDVTEQKRMERELRESKETTDAILAASPVGICLMKGQYFGWANDTLCRMLGYSMEELLGQNARILYRNCEEAKRIGKELFLQAGEFSVRSVETQWVRKDGSIFDCYLQVCALNPTSSSKGQIAVVTDITTRKRNERTLRQLEKAVENTRMGVAITDVEGKLIYVNPAEAQMHGYQVSELIGKDVSIFAPADLKKDFQLNPIDDSKKFVRESINIRKDGSQFPVQLISDIVFDIKGNPLATVTTCEDITHRKQSEENLKKSEERLRELNAAKDKFFSIIAHDIKNPLTAMIGYSDLLVEHYDKVEEETRKDSIRGINSSSKQLLNLLENLLEWSRSQTGRMNFAPEKIDLSYVLNSSLILMKANAIVKKVHLKSEVSQGCIVFVDVPMITTVVRNLLSNAIKFTPEKGGIIISALEKERCYEITIKDNGIGISEKNLKKLFRIGESYSTYGTNNEKGTGLGLILCKEFVEKNGGEIWVESELGKGSRFKFTLQKFIDQGES